MKQAIKSIATEEEFSEKFIRKITSKFNKADKNNDGFLDAREVRHVIAKCVKRRDVDFDPAGLRMYAREIMEVVDVNEDGLVELEEFIKLYRFVMDDPEMQEKLERSVYGIGTHKQDITGPIYGVGVLGFANPEQKIAGLHQRLFCRSFVIQDDETVVALIMTDLWSCTNALKIHVVRAVQEKLGNETFSVENVLISGIHTHAGPGGYAHYRTYNHSIGGFSQDHFDFLVERISESLIEAYNLSQEQEGYLSYNVGFVENCGGNRSHEAFQNNHEEDKELLGGYDTDRTMVILKLVKSSKGKDVPLGVISWYGMHPTALGQNNIHCSSDSKGYASYLFEKEMKSNPDFIAAFPNASCGDVSSNVIQKTHDFVVPEDLSLEENFKKVEHYGNKMYRKAKQLFHKTKHVKGSIEFAHVFRDITNIQTSTGGRTAPGAFGVSVTAGSNEDGRTLTELQIFGSREGTSTDDPKIVLQKLAEQNTWLVNAVECSSIKKVTPKFKKLHKPKPILLALGLDSDPSDPWVPSVLPFQVITLGNLALLNLPGEITSTAGMLLKKKFKECHPNENIETTICGLANGYSGYITTYQEYQVQHYEGASTLYGPHTHQAYMDIFSELAVGKNLDTDAPEDFTSLYHDPAPKLKTELFRHTQLVHNTTIEGSTHQRGETLKVSFLCTNPNLYFDKISNYVIIQGINSDGEGELITTDEDPAVIFHYKHRVRKDSPKRVVIKWKIPANQKLHHDSYLLTYRLGADLYHNARYKFEIIA